MGLCPPRTPPLVLNHGSQLRAPLRVPRALRQVSESPLRGDGEAGKDAPGGKEDSLFAPLSLARGVTKLGE